jgi:hypothetical protein
MAKKTKATTGAIWSEESIAELRKMAPTRPVGIIANTLGRSETSVRAKAAREGISFGSPERSPYGKPAKSSSRSKGKKSKAKSKK